MQIDVVDLLTPVRTLQSPGTRIGWPDDPTPVSVADPEGFAAKLDAALSAFRDSRQGGPYLVSAEVNTYHGAVWIRFVRPGPRVERGGSVEPALEPAFQSLRAATLQNGGDLNYWGGNNYFDISLPFLGPMREASPEVEALPWDDRYHALLGRASWWSLRHMAYRFSDLAEAIAGCRVGLRMSRVLIPSVGLCVHPWLFADRGLNVVATDVAGSALTAVSDPLRWPQLFSQKAFERWDVAQSASYATQGNPHHSTRMPDLQDQAVESLGRRITFALADWADLPLQDGSIDAIFATNALPRESAAEQGRVLEEWGRAVRTGGIIFIAQHNFFESELESVSRNAGWVEANILGGERPAQERATAFQIRYSSG